MRIPFALILLPLVALTACGGSPVEPSDPITLSLPPQVTGAVVECGTCGPPTRWGVAEADVVLANGGRRDRVVATVETSVVNRTRSEVIGKNVRPNAFEAYPDTRLPANGALTLEAAVVYEPLPPPRDEIWFVVRVTFEDGSVVQKDTRLVTPGA